MSERKRSHGLLGLISSIALASGCVALDVPHRADTTVEQSGAIPAEAEDLWFSRNTDRPLVECLLSQTSVSDKKVDVVFAEDFWEQVFPSQSFLRLNEVLTKTNLNKLLHQGFDYLIVASKKPPAGLHSDLALAPLFLGIYYPEIEQEEEAFVILLNLKDNRETLSLRGTAKGKYVGTLLPYPGILMFQSSVSTKKDLCNRLSGTISEVISYQHTENIVKVAFMTPTDYWIHRASVMALTSTQLREKADAGDAEAQLQLYWNTVSNDAREARKWLCRAADQRHPEALYRMGLLYRYGNEGMPQNLGQAYLWYSLAANAGSVNARKVLQALVPKMKPDEVTRGDRLLKAWKPGQCDRTNLK